MKTASLKRNKDIAPTLIDSGSKPKTTKSRLMTADKVQTFLLKDKKARPETAKTQKGAPPAALRTNEVQDDSVNLHKILSYYRDRVEAHEKDRNAYL